jgi:hypothetical protein
MAEVNIFQKVNGKPRVEKCWYKSLSNQKLWPLLLYRQTDRQTDGQTDGQTDRLTMNHTPTLSTDQ